MLLELFVTFFRVGLFTFGGGYAAYPLILESVTEKGWLTESQFADIWGIVNMVPGAVAVNTASYIGFIQQGAAGAVFALLGAVLPSLSLVIIAMYFISKVNESRFVKGAFYGLRPAAIGLIMAAAFRMMWVTFFPGVPLFSAITDNFSLTSTIIFAAAFTAIYKIKIKSKPINPILVIFGCALIGIAIGYMGLI